MLAALSAAIVSVSVTIDWRPRRFLAISIVLSLVYWVLGQGFGGIFEGGATDPNAGLLFVLLACALYTVIPVAPSRPRRGVAEFRRLAGARLLFVLARSHERDSKRSHTGRIVPALLAVLALSGCAAADKKTADASMSASVGGASASGGGGSAATGADGAAGTSGMDMSGSSAGTAAAPAALRVAPPRGAIKPVPMQTAGHRDLAGHDHRRGR